MAYSLPHNMSLQQLTELQEAAAAAAAATSSRFGDRPMEADHHQAGLRHMLKTTSSRSAPENRVEKTDEDSAEDEAGAGADSGENEELDQEEEDEEDAKRNNSSLRVSNSGKQQLQEQDSGAAGAGANQSAAASGPTWLSEAMLARQAAAAAAAATTTPAAAAAPPNYNQWLSIPQPQQSSADLGDVEQQQQQQQQSSVEMNNNNNNNNSSGLNVKGFLELHGAGSDTANSGGGGAGDHHHHHHQLALEEQQQQQQESSGIDSKLWQNARFKADLVTHPLYEQLLSAHISCLRTATPVDQLPKIDSQLQNSSQVAAKYAMLATTSSDFSKDKEEVNEFMAHYVTLLRSFKEQLQQHVRVHAMEAVVACWELEQSLFTLTGVSPGEGTGATMSEDEEEQADCDSGYYDTGMDGTDFTGFGPLIPTETERTLMERVRHELKIELKQGYKAKINDVREEILRKRRAGKLPGDTTSVLKSWWHAHSKWPYPSEDDKARLVQETGLELKQINNWFINQRKRNWHSNPSSSTSLKNKRKR